MSRYYTFHSNTVTEYNSWVPILSLQAGTFFYSPHDSSSDKWGHLVKNTHKVWVSVPKQDMPKEFLVQLLLMGVPC